MCIAADRAVCICVCMCVCIYVVCVHIYMCVSSQVLPEVAVVRGSVALA